MRVYNNLPKGITNKGITFVMYSGDIKEGIQDAKQMKLRYRIIHVLHRNLKHKLDLHNKPYTPNKFLYIEYK